MENLLITRRLCIPRIPPKASSITEVCWNFPSQGWIKYNMVGSALGLPERSGCGGIFKTCRGFTKGYFSWSLGIEFAFKAKIMAFILAIEKAHEFG